MGDSLTSVDVYEPVLVDLLGPDWVTINKGISAQNTTQMLARFQQDIIDPGDAAYVIIWGGAIDVRWDARRNDQVQPAGYVHHGT